jgi:hypothetical protein
MRTTLSRRKASLITATGDHLGLDLHAQSLPLWVLRLRCYQSPPRFSLIPSGREERGGARDVGSVAIGVARPVGRAGRLLSPSAH